MSDYTIEDVTREYASLAESIYHERTAGDKTWFGLLAEYRAALLEVERM